MGINFHFAQLPQKTITTKIFAHLMCLSNSGLFFHRLSIDWEVKRNIMIKLFSALDHGMPVTLIAESVFARCLSSLKTERKKASRVLAGPKDRPKVS